MAEARQFCTFRIGSLDFGVEVEFVQEVIRWQRLTRVPLAPPGVRGLVNLRGQIVVAIDLRTRLGLPPSADELSSNVVLRGDGGAVSLLVDDVEDVVALPDSDFENAPETIDPATRSLIRGVYKTRKRLMLVLDPEKASSVTETRGK